MAKTPVVDKTNAEVLIPTQETQKIFALAVNKSLALRALTRLPDMTSDKQTMKVEDALPVAGFVNGDMGRKSVSSMAWKGKTITAEEIAVIIPFSENVLEDSNFNITAEVVEKVAGAFAEVIDSAIFFGKGAPKTWPMGLVNLAKNKGHVVKLGASYTDQEFYKKILGLDGLYNSVEKDGFPVTKLIGDLPAKSILRGLTDTTGRPLTVGGADINGQEVLYPDASSASWLDATALLLAGDFSNAVYAIRKDLTVKRFTEGVVQDSEGNIVYNLMQNDMIALRFTMRLGWEVANPVSRRNPDAETRYPFSLLTTNTPEELKKLTFTVSSDTGSTKVENATVAVGGISKKTNASGVATIDVPNGYTGTYVVMKGGNVVSGQLDNVTTAKSIAVNNFVVAKKE